MPDKIQQQDPLDRYRILVETKLAIKHRNEWDNRAFEKLSSAIFEETRERISVSTLKRIWGKVDYQSTPTKQTLNILARYAGYDTWWSFTNESLPVTEDHQDQLPQNDTRKNLTKKWPLLPVPLLIVLLVIILLVSGMAFLYQSKNSFTSPRFTTTFKARRTSDDLPNSVVFNYSVTGPAPDSVYIQQSWDSTRREKVSAAGRQHTSIYFYPGFFMAKLIVNGKIEKQAEVFIQTKGWKGIILRKPMPVYLSAKDIHQDNGMGLNAAAIQQKTGLAVFTDTWTEFSNIRPFGHTDGADFKLETTLANTSTVEQALCRNVKITLLGKEGAVIIPLAAKGCSAGLKLLTGDDWIDGTSTDLSALACDFPRFQHVTVAIKNHRLQVMINGNSAVHTRVTSSIGEIIGLRFAFEGLGTVKSIKLYNGHQTSYSKEF